MRNLQDTTRYLYPSLMEEFNEYLIMIQKLPINRARMYVRLVRKFHNYIGTPYGNVNSGEIKAYFKFLLETEKLKYHSLSPHFTAIRHFYKYLALRGELDENPFDGLRLSAINRG